VAILKYCYVDITASTDAAALFSKYDALLRSLRLRFPSITFVAATVPLTTSAAVPGWTRKVWEVNLRRALHLYDVRVRTISSATNLSMPDVNPSRTKKSNA